jgi:cytochrome c
MRPPEHAERSSIARDRRKDVNTANRLAVTKRSRTMSRLALLAMLAIASPGQSFASGDPVHGQQVYKICSACHSIDKNGAGPKHQGVLGRTAGTVPDYHYSPALQKSGIVWNDETLDKWLTDPQALVPGTTMFYAVKSAQDRADVIEFLKQKAGATP